MPSIMVAMLAGFSIVAALILLFVYQFFLHDMRKTLLSRISCTAVLVGLAALQSAHFVGLTSDIELLNSRMYGVLLMTLPAAFFFFSREALGLSKGWNSYDVMHLLPLAAALFIPLAFIAPCAFVIGSVYTAGFAIQVVRLRSESQRFRFELFFFGLFFLMALVALVMGLLLPWLDPNIFVHVYSGSISLAMVMVVAALLVFPELLSDLLLITESSYKQSRLENVDTEALIAQLEQLMLTEHLFEQEELSLATVAEAMEVSPHQLSELINSRFDVGFPRYIREHRVRAAKRMLLQEPNASILSISLAVGFKSQSSFYAAFKELCGESPGQFRRRELA